eukprot:CAMPEP_0201683084 /NCGR_PEP_ID=MMETSP0494-20130426/51941_1 /ASSEMBLY_ACC=CAM_ASM_000839 /TAXON_ID=420259 /ORGANISM="Thalassiosira gravida, Strain GMp14c1" /LENGTH=455 /DNA_ID=CAMNT_0048166853 /DNA_START=224 /DNA_END=1591 /DNA_ORIENTATION=+
MASAADDIGAAIANHPNEKENKQNGDDGSRWRIWSVIDELETNGLSSNSNANSSRDDEIRMTNQVIQILRQWGKSWAGQTGWHTLLNKKSFLHEVEESIVALQLFDNWLERRRSGQDGKNVPPVTLVDVCCGKGILSMLASYLFRGKMSTHVSSIIMLDKQKDINWNHIVASNDSAEEEGRPLIKAWGGCNLHEIDQIVEKLQGHDKFDNGINNGPLALVGIHLCKQLSPACAGVVNSLGPEKCPFLCLAPCCLPRVVRNVSKTNNSAMIPNRSNVKRAKLGTFTVPVRTYESAEDRQARKEANERRAGANKRTFADIPCYLCSQKHSIHKCHLLPSDENERIDIFQKAAALNPCWKCGEIGHFRKDCPSTQQASKPRLTLPPTIELDVASVLQMKGDSGPFASYCDLLSTAVERDNVEVLDVGLVNNFAQHDNAANHGNWNRDRKSIFIVASTA